MITWAFIFEAPQTDPKVDRSMIERGGMHNIAVAIPEPSAIVPTAVDLVAEDAQFIELCGGLEPGWAGKVAEATGGKIPIGAAGYSGGQTVQAMAKIFSDVRSSNGQAIIGLNRRRPT